MDSLDYWRLCDELTVLQAAMLIVGIDPGSEDGAYCDSWKPHEQPKGYGAAKAALCHAINAGRLVATVRYSAREHGWAEKLADLELADIEFAECQLPTGEGSTLDEDELLSSDKSFVYRSLPDWSLTTVQVDVLRDWLTNRGIKPAFFFPKAADAPDYLDRANSRYAPKLAAAVSAWLAVQDPQGKHPKQALTKWLREHSAEFGLSDDDGKPNDQGIDECAKVANWQPGGGAPRTPGA